MPKQKHSARIIAEDSVIASIVNFKAINGYNPSFRDVAEGSNLPLGTVHAICRDLRERRHIRFSDHRARSLEVV